MGNVNEKKGKKHQIKINFYQLEKSLDKKCKCMEILTGLLLNIKKDI